MSTPTATPWGLTRSAWPRVWPPLLAVLVVSAVGAPAAVASYRHARDVVAATGDLVMAPWLPLSVDGLLVASLVVIWVRRHRGDDAGVGPWSAFLFGMVVTILANLAAVDAYSVVTVAVALFPPLALAITLELVAMVAYRTRPAKDEPIPRPRTVGEHVAETPPVPAPAPEPLPVEVDAGPDTEPMPLPYIHDGRDLEPGSPEWRDRYERLPGDSKRAKLEHWLAACWAEGDVPTLTPRADRVVDGNRTGQTAKRALADRGVYPPDEAPVRAPEHQLAGAA